MNINELNRIKVVNLDERLEGTERGTGTFKEILDKVMSGVIIPLVNNAGSIIGINVDTKVENLIDDCVEQRKFEIRYSCKPVMDWTIKALQIKADGKVVESVIENEDEGIKVVTSTGEVIEIEPSHQHYYEDEENDESESETYSKEELPEELDIDVDEIEGDDEDEEYKAIKKYLRRTYGHYLSGLDSDPIVSLDEDEGVYHVTNIHWGRKI